MKLTIIRLDNAVYKDGVCFTGINLNSVPTNIHALQWETDAGWIEYENEAEFKKQPNLVITALPDWATEAVSAWEAAKQQVEQDAIEAKQQAEQDAIEAAAAAQGE